MATLLISIGALAKASGVPVETLRTWERRYGQPRAHRLPSGHRRYDPAEIERMRAARELLSRGHKPADVLALDAVSLQGQLTGGAQLAPDALVDQLLSAAIELDAPKLHAALLRAWDRLGALRFLDEVCGPFVRAVGDAWAQGKLSVAQEHHASEELRQILAARWRAMQVSGPVFVCTTLPGERHHLGLHMAAVVLAVHGHEVMWLGPDTPVAQIVAAVTQSAADGLAISVSQWTSGADARAALEDLRAALPPTVRVVAGGAGAPRDIAGVRSVQGFQDFAELLQSPEQLSA